MKEKCKKIKNDLWSNFERYLPKLKRQKPHFSSLQVLNYPKLLKHFTKVGLDLVDIGAYLGHVYYVFNSKYKTHGEGCCLLYSRDRSIASGMGGGVGM